MENAGTVRFAAIGRGFGGALIFSLPMLMTMEMWWLGFYLDRARLLTLILLNLPVLVLLGRQAGFEDTGRWRDDIRDAFIAYGIGITSGAVILTTLGILTPSMPLDEIIGKIAVQAVPASIGALLARSQFGEQSAEDGEAEETHANEMFLMGIGALFLGLNLAPTDEMVLIGYMMTPWHGMALVVLSILLMHGFVYAVDFSGGTEPAPHEAWWSLMLRFTLPGYVLALLISLYLLWTFGRTDGVPPDQIAMAAIVLGFPASIGAAAARLIL